MSQTTLLEEVVLWSQETCRQELKSVLPKLICMHQDAQGWNEHTRVLKIITDMFLPHLALSELEEECFAKVLPKAVWMFDTLMKEISNQVGGLSSQNTELRALLRNILQTMVQVLEGLSACVRHVCSLGKIPSLDAIRSLPTCILKVLKNTFQHCKESEVLYCGRLSLVGDLLQGLFKEAYSLQKGLMEVLDSLSLESSASDEEVSDVVTVIHSLLDICSLIANLDIALHANTWKFIIKQSMKYQPLVEDHLRHGDISNRLCEDLLASFHSCLELAQQITQAGLQDTTQCPEHKLFQKTTKMCRFFANTLVHYIKEFHCYLSKHFSSFHKLYLQIISKFPPSLDAPYLPSPFAEELSVVALVPMEALLSQLLPLRPFAEVVLRQELELPPEWKLSQCLLLVSVLDQLAFHPEGVLQLWYSGSQFSEETPRLALFRALFQGFRQCWSERRAPVLLPGLMMKGRAQGRVTLHHHVCVHLCASVAALPSEHFPLLERCLLEAVLQADTQTALLATDVWCFMARYGTAELCLHHALLIVHLVKACPGESHQLSHLGLLLRRMVFLMTPAHQTELVERFPPGQTDNLPAWRHVLLRALSPDTRQLVEREVLHLSDTVLTDWQQGGCKLGQLDKVNVVLLSLLVVLRGESAEPEYVSAALRIVTLLWERMCPNQVQSQPVIQGTLWPLFSMSAILVQNLEPSSICQALGCVAALLSQNFPKEGVLAALDFLASLGKVFIPVDCQSQVLPRLSDVFASLLAEKSWLLHQHALEAFAHFAEITNHEEVISHSLLAEETKTKVVNFLSKTISAEETAVARLERLHAETPLIEQHNERLDANKETIMDNKLFEATAESEPSPKRARHETSGEEESRRYIQTAETALMAVQALVQEDANAYVPPQWLASKLQDLQTLLTQITSGLTTTSQ